MSIYRRVYCPYCKKEFELRRECKRTKCQKCGNEIVLTQKNAIYYIEYRRENKRIRERIGLNRKFAENVLNKRKVEIAENKFLDKKKILKVKFSEMVDKYIESIISCRSSFSVLIIAFLHAFTIKLRGSRGMSTFLC